MRIRRHCAGQKKNPKVKMVDKQHAEGRRNCQSKSGREEKIAHALASVGLRHNLDYEGERRSVK